MRNKTIEASTSALLVFGSGLIVGMTFWIPSFMAGVRAVRTASNSSAMSQLVVQRAKADRNSQASSAITALLEKWRKNGALDFRAHEELREQLTLWLNADPVGCLNRLDTQGFSSLLESDILNAWAEEMAATAPGVGFQLAAEIDNSFRQREVYALIFDVLVRRSPGVALNFVEALPRHLQYGSANNLAQAWAAKDPQAAFEAFLNHGGSTGRILDHVAAEWAKVNPEAAFEYLNALSNKTLAEKVGEAVTKNDLWYAFFSELTRKSPEKTVAFLESMPTTILSNDLVVEATGALIARTPDQSTELLAALPNDAARQGALARAAAQSGLQNSHRFLSMVESGKLRTEIVKNIARAQTVLSTTDKALDWAVAIEEPLARNAAVRTVAEFSFREAPADAIETAARLAAENQNGNFSEAVRDQLLTQFKAVKPEDVPENSQWMKGLSSAAKSWLKSNLNGSQPEQKGLLQLLE